jgi:hypothetical protein
VEPTTIPDGWVVDDDALFTAVKLKGLQVGDDVIIGARPEGVPCYLRAGIYHFERYCHGDDSHTIVADVPIFHEHLLAWRPKRG